MKRYPQITCQSYYSYSFRYDSAAWDGIRYTTAQGARAPKLGYTPAASIQPLNNSPLYQPHTKRRHHINDDYWAAIDPKRFDLPVCWKAYEDEAIVIGIRSYWPSEAIWMILPMPWKNCTPTGGTSRLPLYIQTRVIAM